MDSESLKEMVRSELSRQDFQNRLHNIVKEMEIMRVDQEPVHDDSEYGKEKRTAENKALQLLREKGIVEDIVSGLNIQGMPDGENKKISGPRVHSAPIVQPGEGCFLLMEVIRGRAFIEHLVEEESAQMQLNLAFRGQRFHGQWTPCCAEPHFAETFLIRLSDEDHRSISLNDLLATRDAVHMVLLKREPNTGETNVVSSHNLEWRIVLCSEGARATLNIELNGVGAEAKMTVGLLELQLELLPRPHETLSEGIVSSQISLERGRMAERERIFLVYAKQWWREFLQVRESHANRLVKIFAQDENGINRFVCSHVRPLRASRLLESPRQAARFVSCIPYERSQALGSGSSERWSSPHSFVTCNKGDVEDHAILLCSLLLGFGLDAYVAVGTKGRASGSNAVYSWVVTVGNAERDQQSDVIFWDAVSGARYYHRPAATVLEGEGGGSLSRDSGHGFRSIGCVFNHRRFLANNQPTDRIEQCWFTLHDEGRWKAMSEDAIAAVVDEGGLPTLPCLGPPIMNPVAVSNDLESELRGLVADLRRDDGLTCAWDDQLSYLLSQALCAYETERMTGLTVGNEEFQMAIRRHVPDGHTFKGYPLQVQHLKPNKILRAALKSPICQQIVGCRGDFVRMGLRARVYCQAENACATWVMVACTYKSAL